MYHVIFLSWEASLWIKFLACSGYKNWVCSIFLPDVPAVHIVRTASGFDFREFITIILAIGSKSHYYDWFVITSDAI